MSDKKNTFFVGYLDMPPRLALVMAVVAAFLIGSAGALTWIIAANQDDPGSGVWNFALEEFSGTVHLSPYPMVTMADGETALLVGVGKFGVAERMAPFEGQSVRIKGQLVERRGQKLIQIADSADAVEAMWPSEGAAAPPTMGAPKPVTLSGEIVDSKCFLGVMKPGRGKAHKSCATLCVLGGIPPSLMIRHGEDPDDYTFMVLTDMNGNAANEMILPFIGDPVRLSGEMTKIGTLTLLAVDPAAIERL